MELNETPDGLPSPRIIPINIEEEMKSSYIDYSMSVIVSRALPDVRDGLKPVQRRVLYGMNDLGLTPGKAHRKSARIVGEVLGKYHPHGDRRSTTRWSAWRRTSRCATPLVDGQGNFGSVDGDAAAAMRYTEARMTRRRRGAHARTSRRRPSTTSPTSTTRSKSRPSSRPRSRTC